ncbi:MAG: hypothetical protein ACI88S_001867, partial [Ilumatobacter sp.]
METLTGPLHALHPARQYSAPAVAEHEFVHC